MRHSLSPLLAAALLAIVLQPAPRASAQAAPVELRILAINDFHGNLRAPSGGITIADPADKTKKIAVPAGGAEHMATLVRQLREGRGNTVFVAAGDLIGASPLLSAMFHDEPTIESMSLMGLEIASVGNHEFDEGKDELKRMQNGGCHPDDGCQGPHPFLGAKFHYLAASTVEKSSGKTLFPPYEVRQFGGIPVAFIGLTLKGTPDIVSPRGVTDLEFRDEAETVNAQVAELKARGVEAIVVLIHEGGLPTGDYNECPGISGPIVDIVKKFDRAVDVVISGHTHQAYVCEIDGRLVTSGDKYGTLVTAIDLKLDPASRDVISARADNVIVRTAAYAGDPEQVALIESYEKLAAPIANRRAGSITQTLSRVPNAAGESPLGDIIADAQLAATRADDGGGAVIALTNPGGIRSNIAGKDDGAVSYADVFASQPFRNQLVTLTLTGGRSRTRSSSNGAIRTGRASFRSRPDSPTPGTIQNPMAST
jgi:5'-nucleotidase